MRSSGPHSYTSTWLNSQTPVISWLRTHPSDAQDAFVPKPDATITLDFARNRLASVIEKLVVKPDAMQKNLDQLGGLIFSQQVLLALTQAGMSREDAYAAVQRNAMDVWEAKGTFQDLLGRDKKVGKYLSQEVLQGLFDMDVHTKHVDTIFKRVFEES